MTKLKLLVAPGSRPVWFWPITHLVDWPTIFPWASSRKQTARADSIFPVKEFFSFKLTIAFCPVIFGGETVTASCAVAVSAKNTNNSVNFIGLIFMSSVFGFSAFAIVPDADVARATSWVK